MATIPNKAALRVCVSTPLGSELDECKSPAVNPQSKGDQPIRMIHAKFPGAAPRPCFFVLDQIERDMENSLRPGVYHCTKRQREEEFELINTWVCSPLRVDAITFDQQHNNFGRLLRFKPAVGSWREWAMPMQLLSGQIDLIRAELMSMGVEFCPFVGRRLLPVYLQTERPLRRLRCALQVGWCGTSFVLPQVVIGPGAEEIIFQSGECRHDDYTLAGSLQGWQAQIAARAVGNPLLLLALSAAFSGPMLEKCNAESGGFHLVGDSSTGKTTVIQAACATWGGESFRRNWRSTANGMEGAAVLFNDSLLTLDEISECDPKEVGAIIYALGNGRGKQRASRTGVAREVAHWRCFVMSSGERTIATTMLEGGHRAKAGQGVRLLDVPAAQRFGAWDDLHGSNSAAEFSDALKKAAITHHGHAGRAFLGKLTFDTRDFCATLEAVKALPLFTCNSNEGQDKRAAARFALIGDSGELATEYGVTGWPEGAAIKAAAHGFRLWQSLRGTGNAERQQILQRVLDFIEKHGDGRFSDADCAMDVTVRDRAGWWRDASGSREYLFTAGGMRDALTGFDFKRALDVLQDAKVLPLAGASGERARNFRIGGRSLKLYPVSTDRLLMCEHGL